MSSGESFDLMDGVLGMALSPYRSGNDRFLYFHALASSTENVVRTSVLRNDSFMEDSNADRNAMNVSYLKYLLGFASFTIVQFVIRSSPFT